MAINNCITKWRLVAQDIQELPKWNIGSQFLDGRHSHGWQILATQPWASVQKVRRYRHTELTVEKEREGRGNVWRHAHIQTITHGILVHAHISKHQWLPWDCRHFLLILLNYIITCIKKHWMLNPFPHIEPLRLGAQRGFYSHYLNQCFPIISSIYLGLCKIYLYMNFLKYSLNKFHTVRVWDILICHLWDKMEIYVRNFNSQYDHSQNTGSLVHIKQLI